MFSISYGNPRPVAPGGAVQDVQYNNGAGGFTGDNGLVYQSFGTTEAGLSVGDGFSQLAAIRLGAIGAGSASVISLSTSVGLIYMLEADWNSGQVSLAALGDIRFVPATNGQLHPPSCGVDTSGNLNVINAGAGLQVAEGANAKQGVATLVAGTVTVANTSVTANSRIFLTTQQGEGVPGALYISGRTAGIQFVVKSTSAADASTFAYEIFEPTTLAPL
jgi:hypothetical protein